MDYKEFKEKNVYASNNKEYEELKKDLERCFDYAKEYYETIDYSINLWDDESFGMFADNVKHIANYIIPNMLHESKYQ